MRQQEDSTINVAVAPPSEKTVADYLDVSGPSAIKPIIAKHFTPSSRGKGDIHLVVIHSMEGSEVGTKAESCAYWFAGRNARYPAPRASAHYAVDNDSIVQMVSLKDVAWHAPGANHNGVGIEHAGKAKQTRDDWLDDFSKAMLLISAGLTARICKAYELPVQFVDSDALLAGDFGITTHDEVTKAFKKSSHTDPGKHFPMDWYLQQVLAAYDLL